MSDLLSGSGRIMSRANRYYLPGLVWHITHRCHNRDFLLKFRMDRDRYRHWLYEAKKRYGLTLLNYTLTCNHIHLLAYDNGKPGVIERSMQLAEGRIAQEYNHRQGRVGAFWQDRYHATAVQSGRHLRNCFTYIDLNMVRAGVVKHPSQWPTGGYQEIHSTKKRNVLLDIGKCLELLGFSELKQLSCWQNAAIEEKLAAACERDLIWTQSVAVGDAGFLEQIAQRLGSRGRFKAINGCPQIDGFALQEEPGLYLSVFGA